MAGDELRIKVVVTADSGGLVEVAAATGALGGLVGLPGESERQVVFGPVRVEDGLVALDAPAVPVDGCGYCPPSPSEEG